MNPALKYSLGRVGIFVAAVALLMPLRLSFFLTLMIALLISMALSFFLLKKWRLELTERMAESSARRQAEKARLRAELSGSAESDEPRAPSTNP